MAKVKASIKGGVGHLKSNERKEKLKYSGYHITLNTNMKYKPDDPHLKEDAQFLSEVVHDRFLSHLDSFVTLGPNDRYDDDKVKSAEVVYAVEYGAKGQLHTHILIQFQHTNERLGLNYKLIKETVAKALGLPSIYFNAHLIRGSQPLNMSNYVGKTLDY